MHIFNSDEAGMPLNPKVVAEKGSKYSSSTIYKWWYKNPTILAGVSANGYIPLFVIFDWKL